MSEHGPGAALRELAVLIGFDIDKTALDHALHTIDGVHKKLSEVHENAKKALEGLLIYEAAEQFMQVAEGLEQTALAAEKLGMSTEEYQKLAFAADQTGLSVEGVAHSFSFLQRNMAGAAEGSQEQAAAFAKLGIKVKDVNGKTRDTNEVFEEVADKFKDIQDPTKKAQLAMKLFGRAGVEIIPLLNRGGDAIREFGEEAEALGLITPKEQIAAAKEFLETWKTIKSVVVSVARTALAPIFVALSKIGHGLIEWWKANQKLITLGVASWFQAIADVISVIAQFFEPLVWIVGEVIKGFAEMNPWVVILTAAGAAMLLAWSPLIAALVLFGLVLEDVYTYFKGGKSVTGDLIARLKDLWAQFGMKLPDDGFIGFLIHTALPLLKRELEALSIIMGALMSDPLSLPGVIKNLAVDAYTDTKNAFGGGANARSVAQATYAGGAGPLLPGSNASYGAAGPLIQPTNNITINAQTGASAAEIAGHVRATLDEQHDKNMREAYSALVPVAQ